MRQVQLYINNERIDLFDDENISITDSIKNVKDISKVFTTFSKQFTVPASKINNKIFKHYYNYDINNGFDARFKQDARIDINQMTFKKGKIKLDGVKMQNNKPFAYKITFFGETVDLKDILGEDKLTELSQLGNLELPYTNQDIIDALTDPPGETAIALITAEQRLYYDSDVAAQEADSGNVYYDGTTVQGIKPKQLKYSLRLDKIIEAIENEPRYGGRLQFSDDSFFKSGTTDISKLYMWLHRKKGTLEEELAGAGSNIKVQFAESTGSPYFNIDTDSNAVMASDAVFAPGPPVDGSTVLVFTAGPSTVGVPFDLVIKKNGNTIKEYIGITSLTEYTVQPFWVEGDVYSAFIRTYDTPVTFSELSWTFYEGPSELQTEDAILTTYEAAFLFNVQDQIPEQKVIDFLSSLFKMFNLVAYVQKDGKINVQPLNDYYTNIKHDITQFVDISSSEIDVALPYKEIQFKYKDTNTILAKQHLEEISDVEWGGAEYDAGEESLSGGIYKIEPDFSHVKFEKLIDDNNPAQNTSILYGYFVDDKGDGYRGSPFIHYINYESAVTNSNGISVNDNGTLVHFVERQYINMPSNLETLADETSPNIHFNAELSEFDGELAENTLFSRFYEKYIANIFDLKNRLTKVTAYLPVTKLADYGNKIELSDVIVINDRLYRINSMKVDITTGKASFELLNTNWIDIAKGALISLIQSGGVLTGTGTVADPYTLLVESYGSGGDIPNWIWSITGQSTTLNIERTTNISNFIVRAYQSTNSTSRGTLIGSSTTSALTFTFNPANGEYLWIQGTTEDGDENTLYANEIKFWES